MYSNIENVVLSCEHIYIDTENTQQENFPQNDTKHDVFNNPTYHI